ncbi:unnamed protein product [Rangifer tarandus platyrhynchus]|uniref:Uncharacterized protein n=2 Tax=Rangifer tarandus platyrhynchus TaxID=3082113 RepID=A0AC59YVT3_RANTA|nr:unnamed protein product [Rangifer tarandus platyrhynchus]
MPVEAVSGPRPRVLICGLASVFSIPSSHSPPARCLGRLEQMFHLGLTDGFKPGLQRSDLWLPISFPKKPRRLRQAELSFCRLRLPAAAGGRSGGTRRKGQGLHRGFCFP